MRLSELNGKEIINLVDGTRLGVFYKVEALCDLSSGRIHSFLLAEKQSLLRKGREIPWQNVKKISKDLLLVELEPEAFSKKTSGRKRD